MTPPKPRALERDRTLLECVRFNLNEAKTLDEAKARVDVLLLLNELLISKRFKVAVDMEAAIERYMAVLSIEQHENMLKIMEQHFL